MIKRILYVVTATREALEGATFVAELAKALGAQIIGYSVVDTSAAQRLTQATGQPEGVLYPMRTLRSSADAVSTVSPRDFDEM